MVIEEGTRLVLAYLLVSAGVIINFPRGGARGRMVRRPAACAPSQTAWRRVGVLSARRAGGFRNAGGDFRKCRESSDNGERDHSRLRDGALLALAGSNAS